MSVSDPRYAVIIVTYQRAEALQRTLAAVVSQSVGRAAMELCVVDNGGTEPAKASWQDEVDVWIDAGANLGCAGGRNRGVEHTRAPVLVFIDDDGIPAPDFIERLGDVLDAHPEAIAVRGRAVALHHPLLTTMAVHYHRGPRSCDDLLTLEGASAIQRADYEAVGGYDASRAYHEGLELSGRLLAARPSGRILYTPQAVLAHDYLQGWAHLLRKAKMVAAADERIDGTDDPNVQAMLERLHALQLADGRARWQRIVGAAVQRTFRAVVGYYRWRGR